MKVKKMYRVSFELDFECTTLDEATDAIKYVQAKVDKLFEKDGGLSHCIRNERNEYHSIHVYTKDETEKE